MWYKAICSFSASITSGPIPSSDSIMHVRSNQNTKKNKSKASPCKIRKHYLDYTLECFGNLPLWTKCLMSLVFDQETNTDSPSPPQSQNAPFVLWWLLHPVPKQRPRYRPLVGRGKLVCCTTMRRSSTCAAPLSHNMWVIFWRGLFDHPHDPHYRDSRQGVYGIKLKWHFITVS